MTHFVKYTVFLLLLVEPQAWGVPSGQSLHLFQGWRISQDAQALTPEGFLSELETELIPGFVSLSKNFSASAFSVLLPAAPEVLDELRLKGVDLPDGLHLRVFSARPSFLQFEASSEGKQFQEIVRSIYDRGRSRDLVFELYDGFLTENFAVDVLGPLIDWSKIRPSQLEVRFSIRKPGVPRSLYLGQLNLYSGMMKRFAEKIGLKGLWILVGEQYWMEIRLWETFPQLERGPVLKIVSPIREQVINVPVREIPATGGSVEFGSMSHIPLF